MKIYKILIFALVLPVISACSPAYEEEGKNTLKTTEVTNTPITEGNNSKTTIPDTKVSNGNRINPTITNNKTENEKKADNKTVSYNFEKFHAFSIPGKKDHFLINLIGKDIMNGDVNLKIISSEAKVIYNEKLKGYDLIGYGLVEQWGNGKHPTIKQQEDFILKRMKEFFLEKNFVKPAVPPKDLFVNGYNNKVSFNELKAQPEAIGFYYLVGKEDGRDIAFSKKQNKVVMYRNCC